MIDWLTCTVPILHKPFTGGAITKTDKDGVVVNSFALSDYVEGSYSGKVSVSTVMLNRDGWGTTLRISGNIAKFLQGHNIDGSDDATDLIIDFLNVLVERDVIEVTDFWNCYTKVDFENKSTVTRCDATYSYQLETLQQVLAVIKSLSESAQMKYRGRGTYYGDSIIFGGQNKQGSRYSSLMAYAKGPEQRRHKSPIMEIVGEDRYLAECDKLLRLEARCQSKLLKTKGIKTLSDLTTYTPRQLWLDHMNNLQIPEKVFLTNEDISKNLTPTEKIKYEAWRAGADLKQVMSRSAYYRTKSKFMALGVNIDDSCRKASDNVIPIVRILEAKPYSAPSWLKVA